MLISRRSGTRRATGLAAVTVLLMAGCGGGDPAPELDPEVPDQTAPEPDPAPEPEPDPPADEADPGTDEGEDRTTVQVFFARDGVGDPCEDVVGVDREVSAEDPLGEALVALLAGPTEAEQDDGFGGWFSDDTAGMLRGYRSEGELLIIDFDDLRPVIPNASTSCGSTLLFAQLDETVAPFDLGEPRYALEGDQEAFYAWLQRGVPE